MELEIELLFYIVNNIKLNMEQFNEELIGKLKLLLDEADEDAKKFSIDNKILGRITRFQTVKLGEREELGIDIAFEDYITSNVKRGEYLAIRTIIHPVIVIGRIVAINRSDILAQLGLKELNYPRDPTTIITSTHLLLTPVSEYDLLQNEIRPAVSPIDPQSPVFRPKPELLEKALGIPNEGLVISNIYSGGNIIKEAKVRIDEETLKHHTLIIGTTGSGKTTLLKRILESDDIKKKALVFDRQGDFIRLGIEKLNSFVAIMPIARNLIDEKGVYMTPQLGEIFAEKYDCEKSVTPNELGLLLLCGGKEVLVIPYSIKFSEVLDKFHKITPYFSQRATMVWEALIKKFNEKIENNVIKELKEKLKINNINYLKKEIYNRLSPANFVDQTLTFKDEDLKRFINNYQLHSTSKSEFLSIDKESLKIYTNRIFDKCMEELNLQWQTKDSIIRTLKAYDEYGIFSVEHTYPFKVGKVFNQYDNVIIDLTWLMDYTASTEALATVAYKILDDVFIWKDILYKQGVQSELLLLIIDEAHEYFPQSYSENVSKETVESFINRIMRLGRVRNIGVVMATHMPDDLNQLVIQLSNTKIIMRNDESILKKLGLQEYSDILSSSTPPGVGLINSIKFSRVLMKVIPP